MEFPPIRFTLDDLKKSDGTFASSRTFQYIIREARSPNADSKGFDKTTNIQYDKTDRPVTVTLSLDGSKLKAEVNYGKKGVPVFVNTKKPPEKPKNGSSTGDTAVLFPYILLLLLSLLTASIAVLNRRRRNS